MMGLPWQVLPVVPTSLCYSALPCPGCSVGWRLVETLHLGLLGLSSHLCGGFSLSGGPGELWDFLGHPDMSLFLLPPSHFFRVL